MSTSAITSSLLSSVVGSSGTANRFATDLNTVAKDLQSGNLSAAQQDFVTLSQDAQNGVTAASATTSASGITTGVLANIAGSSSAENSLVSDLNQLGTDLANSDLNSAQGDMLTLDSLALQNASSSGSSSPAATAPTSQGDTKALIQSITEAMSVGDNALAGSALTQLASISTSSQGATLLAQAGAAYGSASGASSGSSSIEQLLQSGSAGSSNAPSLLSELA